MKTFTTTLLALSMSMASMTTTIVSAVEKEHKGSTSSETQTGHANREKMDTHMKMMKIQMQAIHEETDPEKREVLMQAHRQSMHEGMKIMHGMGGHGMMGMMHGEKHKGMKGKTGKMSEKEHNHSEKNMDEHACMERMEYRMDDMQMMMEQMMQHEDAMHQHSKN